jgi:hypothetical protein
MTERTENIIGYGILLAVWIPITYLGVWTISQEPYEPPVQQWTAEEASEFRSNWEASVANPVAYADLQDCLITIKDKGICEKIYHEKISR